MRIDFSATSQNNANEIEFYNVRGQVVKTYQLSELERYVIENDLNVSYSHDAVGGTGMVSDPNTDFVEVEQGIDLTDFIDENWSDLTEKFYNAMNPNEYQSNNLPQQTRKVG